MKPLLIMAWLFLALAFALSLGNMISGLELSRGIAPSPQWHLIRAIAMVTLGLLSSSLLVLFFQKMHDQLAKQLLIKQSNTDLPKIFELRRAHGAAFVLILLLLMSLLSGSTATAGRFPLLHSILGFGLIACFFVNLMLWAIAILKIFKLERDLFEPPRANS
jgi:MFS family permease